MTDTAAPNPDLSALLAEMTAVFSIDPNAEW
jgi:hypothetical protein